MKFKYSKTYVEQSLGFPEGHLDNEKNMSVEMLALAKMVELFPWLIEVAADDYSVVSAKRMMIKLSVDAGFFDECDGEE